MVLLPHLVGSAEEVMRQPTSWPTIVEHTELVVAFGGIPAKNVFVTPGGMTEHRTRELPRSAAARGIEFALVSPVRNDLPPQIPATWYPVVPGTDVALMLALAHTLLVENLADRAFLDRYSSGADVLRVVRARHRRRRPEDRRMGERPLSRSRPTTSASWRAAWRRFARWSR